MRTHQDPQAPSEAEPTAQPEPAAPLNMSRGASSYRIAPADGEVSDGLPAEALQADGELGDSFPAGMDARPVEASRARGIMKTASLLAASAFIGGLIGALVIFLALGDFIGPRGGAGVDVGEPVPTAPAPSGGIAGTVPSQLPLETEWTAVVDEAGRLVAAGKLREAQDLYLTVLLVDPSHQAAMKGLVRVRRLMADGDPAVLLRQADAFRRAIAQGVETDEHYTAPAMELLARASQQAASDLRGTARAEAGPAPRPAPRVESAPQTKPSASPPAKAPTTKAAAPPRAPAPAPKPAARPRPAPAKPAPVKPPAQKAPTPAPSPSPPPAPTTPARSAAATPEPAPAVPLNANEPFYTVTVGPFDSGERASAIVAELTVAGYAARVRRQGPGNYIITVGPIRQSVAERAAAFLRSRFGQSLPVALARAP